jgi:hypothetical protein
MSKVVESLDKALDRFEKTVNTSFAGPVPTSLLARQDLEAAIVVLSDRMTPFRDRVTRIRGEGLAHLWNQRTSLATLTDGPLALSRLFYADGDLPPSTDPAYVQKTAAYKYMGTTAVITGPMIASGRSYTDIEAEIAEAALRRIIQAEEWADFHGDNTVDTLTYAGFDVQIVTNIVNAAGSQLTANGVVIPLFDKLIKLIRLQGGNKIDGIYLGFGLQTQVNSIVAPAARYVINIEQEGRVVAGDHAVSYMGPLGSLPVIGDFFCNPALPYAYNEAGSSGATGSGLSSVYFLRYDEQGVQMVDLVPLGRTELAKIADTIRFYINQYTVLALKAEPWVGMITNVGDPA